jgi:hypothetical protein
MVEWLRPNRRTAMHLIALARWLARKAVTAEWKAQGRKVEFVEISEATNVYFMEHGREPICCYEIQKKQITSRRLFWTTRVPDAILRRAGSIKGAQDQQRSIKPPKFIVGLETAITSMGFSCPKGHVI